MLADKRLDGACPVGDLGFVTERQGEWDARALDGSLVGYGFATQRRAANFLKRHHARRAT